MSNQEQDEIVGRTVRKYEKTKRRLAVMEVKGREKGPADFTATEYQEARTEIEELADLLRRMGVEVDPVAGPTSSEFIYDPAKRRAPASAKQRMAGNVVAMLRADPTRPDSDTMVDILIEAQKHVRNGSFTTAL